jgi:hypothetical protein
MAFVVQEAAEKMSISSGLYVLVYTMNNIWYAFTGAVNNTYVLL